jgi:hypothetical protein
MMPNKESMRAAKWNKDNSNYRREYMRNYRETHDMSKYNMNSKKSHKKWEKNNRIKVNAKAWVYRNKITYENCAVCNSNKNIHAHHENYNLPNVIIFLCGTCHQKIHMGVL